MLPADEWRTVTVTLDSTAGRVTIDGSDAHLLPDLAAAIDVVVADSRTVAAR